MIITDTTKSSQMKMSSSIIKFSATASPRPVAAAVEKCVSNAITINAIVVQTKSSVVGISK